MRRWIVILVVFAVAISLCGCGKKGITNDGDISDAAKNMAASLKNAAEEEKKEEESYNEIRSQYYAYIDKIEELNAGKNMLNGDKLTDYDFYYSTYFLSAFGCMSEAISEEQEKNAIAIKNCNEFFGVSVNNVDQVFEILEEYFSYHSNHPNKEMLKKMIDKYCSLDSISFSNDEISKYGSSNAIIYKFEIHEPESFLRELHMSERWFAADLLMLKLYTGGAEFNDATHSISFSIPSFEE